MFLRAPQISTVLASDTTVTLKFGVSIKSLKSSPTAESVDPIVVSQNFSSATLTRESFGSWFQLPCQWSTRSLDELVRQDEDEEVGVEGGVGDVGDGHHVGRQLPSGQVLDIFVFSVDNFGQIPSVDLFLKDPHFDCGVELFWTPGGVQPNQPCNS